jgi:hypothetical protein
MRCPRLTFPLFRLLRGRVLGALSLLSRGPSAKAARISRAYMARSRKINRKSAGVAGHAVPEMRCLNHAREDPARVEWPECGHKFQPGKTQLEDRCILLGSIDPPSLFLPLVGCEE